MNYYLLHIGDYKSHTSHLSLIEDLAYRRMLDLYYLTESPLPDIKKIARAICMRENLEEIQTIIDEFFIDTNEGYIHSRCEREIKSMNDKSGKAKASAQMRWKKERNANAQASECDGNANASNNHANASNNHANASNLDANAMRDGCEGNAPNPNPNPNPNINNKKNASEVFGSPNIEHEPDYLKRTPNQPHETRIIFGMTADWQPTESINALLMRNGLVSDYTKIDPDRLADFVNHWLGKPDQKPQDGWHGALAGWLKRTQHDKLTTKQQPTFKQKQPEITPPVYKNWSLEPDEPLKPKITREQLAEMRRIVDGEK